jgi:hypothetical protein
LCGWVIALGLAWVVRAFVLTASAEHWGVLFGKALWIEGVRGLMGFGTVLLGGISQDIDCILARFGEEV